MSEKIEPQKMFSEEQFNTLQNIVKGAYGDTGGSGISNDDAKNLETVKIILAYIGNDEYLSSLTNLSDDELEDINDAMFLNIYFDNPRITQFIYDRLKLSRSRTGTGVFNNLLHILSEISGKSINTLGLDSGLNNILGKRR